MLDKPFLRLSGTRLRIFLLVFLGTSLSVVLFGIYVHRSWTQMVSGEFDVELYNLAIEIRDNIEAGDPPETVKLHKKILPFDPLEVGYQFMDLKARTISRWPDDFLRDSSEDIPKIENTEEMSRGSAVFHTWDREMKEGKKKSYRIVEIGVDLPFDNYRGISGVLQIAVPAQKVVSALQAFRREIFFSTVAVLILVLLGSYTLARLSLKPIEKLIQDAGKLKGTELTTRIPLPKGDEGLIRLASVLNELLDEISHSTESQERFIREASHQLKTPLAVMSAELESVLRDPSASLETKKLAEEVTQQAQYLNRLVQGLLVLARVTRGERTLFRAQVSIPEVVFEVMKGFSSLANEKAISFKVNVEEGKDFLVEGDEALLRSLIETLLDNAIEHSSSGSRVEISIHSDRGLDGGFSVTIQDQGPGIPHHLKEKVFERFFKGDRSSKGFGLGLSIAKEIVLAHGGSIQLQDAEPGGLRVKIGFNKP